MYAISVAPLMAGFVRILQFEGDIRFFLPQALVALFLILGIVVVWWTMWWFREIHWSFATYLLVIAEPLIMFLSCSLIFPRRIRGDVADLESHYYMIRVPLLVSMLVWFVLVFTDDFLLGLEPLWHSRRYIHLIVIALILWALVDRRKAAQTVLGLGLLAGTLAMIVGWFWVPAN